MTTSDRSGRLRHPINGMGLAGHHSHLRKGQQAAGIPLRIETLLASVAESNKGRQR